MLYRALQKQLQQAEEACRSAMERETSLSLSLHESRLHTRLLEEENRHAKEEEDSLRGETGRLNELLQLEKQTSQSLELSLRRERTLTSQLQQRATTLQRSVEDLQQRLRVGESL